MFTGGNLRSPSFFSFSAHLFETPDNAYGQVFHNMFRRKKNNVFASESRLANT
jgi:hypothetical protein